MIPQDLDSAYQEGCRLFYRRLHPEEARAEAQEVFREILRRDPGHHRSHNMLGLCREARGEREAARESFRAALDLSPRGVYHLNLGISLANDGRWEEALAALEAASRLEPLDPAASWNLGLAQQALGRHEEAASSWRRTMEQDPDREGIHLTLALALLERGRLDEVEEVLLAGVKRRPGDEELHRSLASVYESTGRFAEATRLWEEFLLRDPAGGKKHLDSLRRERDRLRALGGGGATAPAPPRGRARKKAP